MSKDRIVQNILKYKPEKLPSIAFKGPVGQRGICIEDNYSVQYIGAHHHHHLKRL